MTLKRNWEIQLSVAVRAFLDRYGPEAQTPEEAHTDFVELDMRMNGRFHDEWLALRAERDAKNAEEAAEAGRFVGDGVDEPARSGA